MIPTTAPCDLLLPATDEPGSMSYSHTLYDTIDQVDLPAWNTLCHSAGDPFMDPRFIRAVEKSMAGDGRFWHVIFRDSDGNPAAAASVCSYRADATLLAEGFAGKVARLVGRIAPSLVKFNILFCGLPVSAGQSHLRFAPGVDTAAILRSLDEILGAIACREKVRAIVFKEFDDAECERLAALAELGYRRADSLPMNHTSPAFRDFDHFLSSLPSRKRYAIRKSQKKFQAAGLRVVQISGGNGAAAMYTDEVHKLYEAVLERAKVRLERLPPAFFRELAARMPDETAFTFIYDGDRVVAFAASMFTPAAFHQMFVGVNYELNPQVDLYFNLFFHALDYGFKQNAGDVIVGQSADTFKQRQLGGHSQPLHFFVKGADWLSRLVLRHGFNTLFPPRRTVENDDV